MPGYNILIVEDEPIIAKMIGKILESHGYEVPAIVSTGQDALEVFRSTQIDLVLMDIMLKGDMDGIDTALQIKKNFDTPIIYLTAYSDDHTIQRSKETTPYGYIVKPIQKAALHSAIQTALFKKESERKLNRIKSILATIRNVNQLIIREKDRAKLIDGICKTLVESNIYINSWLVLLDKSGKPTAISEAGNGLASEKVKKLFHMDETPQCLKEVLLKSEVIIINAKDDLYKDCPSHDEIIDNNLFMVRLGLNGIIHGVLTVTLPENILIDKEETELFKDLANDITFALQSIINAEQHRITEIALIEREEHLRLLIETSPVAIVVSDKDQETIAVNKKFTELFGYTREDILAIEDWWPRAYPDPEYREKIKADWNRRVAEAIKSNSTIEPIEASVTCKNGAVRHIEFRFSSIGDRNIITFIDLTARRHAGEKIRSSELRYRTIFEGANDAIFQMKGDTFIDCNSKTEQIFGCSREKILQKKPYEFSPHVQPDGCDSKVKALEKINAALSGNPQFFEWKHIKYDGTPFDAEVSLNRIEVEDVTFIQAIVRDISERKNSEEALKESEERFRNIFDNSAVGLYRTSIDGKVLLANPALIAMFGYSSYEQFVKQNVITLYAISKQRQSFLNILRAEEVIYGFEEEMVKKDGSKIFVLISGKLVKDKAGNELYIEGVIEDITHRKQFENALIEAKNKAEESEKLKSEFLAQISHEIRSPINIILSFSDLIKNEVKEFLDEEIFNSFSSIEMAGRRIIRTIDLILNMSEIQTGIYEPAFKEIDIYTEVLKNIKKEFSITAASKNIDLILTSKIRNTNIFADEYSVNQIIVNLVDNALKYTKKGKIEIKLLRGKNKKLIVEISDTGIGISKKYLPIIFDPFSQEEQGYTRKFEGTGLGLALVKKYCGINNAEIKVESSKGKGTTFTVTFNSSLPGSKIQ